LARQRNTNTSGKPSPQATVDSVWNKARSLPHFDPDVTRTDSCGARIDKADYGKTTQHGWEIDHVKPVAEGGTDDLSNLQPLHWENNRAKVKRRVVEGLRALFVVPTLYGTVD